MTDDQMKAAILNAIQSDANLLTLIRAAISNTIAGAQTITLQTAMAALNLPTS